MAMKQKQASAPDNFGELVPFGDPVRGRASRMA